MSGLTEEQKRRMEENRRKALEKRNAMNLKTTNNNSSKPVTSNFTNNTKSNTLSNGSSTSHQKDSSKIFPIFNQSSSLTKANNNEKLLNFVSSGSNFKTNQNNSVMKDFSNNNGKTFSLKSLTHSSSNSQTGSVSATNFYGTRITGNFSLLSKDRFIVEVGFHTQTIEIFKLMTTRQYDSTTKKWNFAISEHNKLANELKALRPEVCISPLPDYVLKILKDSEQVMPNSRVDLTNLDPQLLEAFFPFQQEGVCCGISRGGRILIADDMGLGKTIQALGIASYYRYEWPLLIICPASVRYSWADAISKWMPSVCTSQIAVLDSAKDVIEDVEIVICSYDLIPKKSKEFKDNCYRVIIMDESHMIKCFKTARFKAVDPLMKQANRLVLLSGTPALSRPSELYTQVTGVKKSIFPSFQTFGIRYCAGKQTNWGWNFNGSSNMEELQVILESSVMIRRLKADVINQLPSKQRMVTILDPSSVKLGLKDLEKAAKKFDHKDLKGSEKQGALLQFFAETAHAKLKAVSEFVKDMIEGEKKFIIFAHHKVMLDSICETCNKCKVRYIRIDGSTNADARNQLVELFQTKDDIKVAVLSIVAASTGITLTAAHLVVFAELFWNPGILAQAEDRAHRIGQKDCVIVQYLLAKGTSDDHIWNLVREKLQVLNKAGLSKDNFNASDQSYQKSHDQHSILEYLNIEDFDDEMLLPEEPVPKKTKL